MPINYLDVTELAGDEVSKEQVDRLCNRYYWAGTYCQGKDVLEAACGTGQGLGYLSEISRTLKAGDFSEEILEIAKEHYGNKIDVKQFDAQDMPFPDNSLDIVILFEAIYYLTSAEKFVQECKRVLRDGGYILISTANKDLYDFNPSPYSYKYYSAIELNELFSKYGFSVECYGDTPINKVPLRQKILRPVKSAAVKFNLIPKSMTGKKILKKFVFGNLVEMPAEINESTALFNPPEKIPIDKPNMDFKVIYCCAKLTNK